MTSNKPLNKKASGRDKHIVKSLQKKYTSILSEYSKIMAENTSARKSFVTRTSSTNPYLSKIITLPTGEAFYVTAGGVARYLESDAVRESVLAQLGTKIPPEIVDIQFKPHFLKSGTMWPTTPQLISGTPVAENETIGREGTNVLVNSIINPNRISSPIRKNCSKNVSDPAYFIGSAPSDDDPTSTLGEYTFKACMDAAITRGSEFFGLSNVNSETNLGYCSAAPTLDAITSAGAGTITTVIPLWSSQTTGSDNSASMTGSGSLSVMSEAQVNIFSTPMTSQQPSNYIGCYGDAKDRRLSNKIGSGQTYSTCRDEAAKTNYLFFGIQNRQPDDTGECWGGNDLTHATGLGKAGNCTVNDSGVSLGGGWSNAIYSTSPNEAFFLILTDDGNMKVYRGSGPTDQQELLWESKTTGRQREPSTRYSAENGKTGENWMSVGVVLKVGEFIGSTTGNIYLMMQKDGNLVLSTSVAETSCRALSGGVFGGHSGSTAVYQLGLFEKGVDANSAPVVDSINKMAYVSFEGTLHEFPDNKLSLSNQFIKRENYNISTSSRDPLEIIQDTSALNCQTACGDNSSCIGATFNKTINQCTLHDAYEQGGPESLSDPNVDSYIRERRPTVTPSGASAEITQIDSRQYNQYPRGDDISDKSLFGISRPINTPHQERLSQMTGELQLISKKLVQLTGKFNQSEIGLSEKALQNAEKINQSVEDYDRVQSQITGKASEAVRGINNINEIYTTTTVYDQYQYILWTILAIIFMAIIAKLSSG